MNNSPYGQFSEALPKGLTLSSLFFVSSNDLSKDLSSNVKLIAITHLYYM